MHDDFAMLASASGSVRVDLALGNIAELVLNHEGRALRPLHRAPRADDPIADRLHGVPLVERRLSGDFFCAPFGVRADAPIHGPAANSRWRQINRPYSDGASHPVIRLELGAEIQGAKIVKELALGAGAPLLYQSHLVSGGAGSLPIATHRMIRASAGDRISFSAKVLALTPDDPIVPGRHWLAYPARGSDLTAFPAAEGKADLTRFPSATGHEDFVLLIEAPGSRLGWTAIVRETDVVFVLKDPAVLPVTQVWWSNGGRLDAPWNGRHTGVLGVEDARVPTDATGVPRGLELAAGATHAVSHAIGAIGRPKDWQRVEDIRLSRGELTLIGDTGTRVAMPFAERFF